MLSWKDLSELAGSTSRVYTLLSTLHDLSVSSYASMSRPLDLPADAPFYDLGTLNGKLVDSAPPEQGVIFDKVPIVAPAPGVARGGEELVKQLSVKIKPGEHLLITGGNGSGKTAIARVLAGLWPVWEGFVSRPDDSNIMFLPQRPYLSSGSLRDQYVGELSLDRFGDVLTTRNHTGSSIRTRTPTLSNRVRRTMTCWRSCARFIWLTCPSAKAVSFPRFELRSCWFFRSADSTAHSRV